jgi:hypothetical protein
VNPRAGLDRCEESRPPLGFDPWTAQPVASRYTGYVTRPTPLGNNYLRKDYLKSIELMQNIELGPSKSKPSNISKRIAYTAY